MKYRLLPLSFLCVSFLSASISPLAADNQGISANAQKNIDTLNNYYGEVQKRARLGSATNQANRSANFANSEANNRSTPRQKSAFVPDNTRYAAPISGANRQSAAYTPAGRDPFAVTSIMLDNETFTLKKEIDFTPLQGDFKIPNMRLKGVITGSGKSDALTALLEIEGLGVFVVREGDTVGLQGVGNGRDVIQIESVNRLSLVVRTGSYGGQSDRRFVVR